MPVMLGLSNIFNAERCGIHRNGNSRVKQNTGLRHKVKEDLGGEMNVMSTFRLQRALSANTVSLMSMLSAVLFS